MKAKKKPGPKRAVTYTPNTHAMMYLHDIGPFTLRFHKEQRYGTEWCDVYKGRKRVWDCNANFARAHLKPSTAKVVEP